MLSLKTFANCSDTTSFKVASPSPSSVKAVRCGKAASKRIWFAGFAMLTG